MSGCNTEYGQCLTYDSENVIFDYENDSPEAIPDLAYSQPVSQPLSRFNSSNGSSSQANSDPQYLPSVNEAAYDQHQYELYADQAAQTTSYLGSYDGNIDGFDAMGSQFNPATISPSFSTSPTFDNLQVHDQAPTSHYTSWDAYQFQEGQSLDFSDVSPTYNDLPDVSQYFSPTNTASQAFLGQSLPYDTYHETPLTYAAPPTDQLARRPRHYRSSSSMERLRRSKRDSPYVCREQGCNAKPFNRPADLDRHYIQLHGSDKEKKSFYCDYGRCNRATSPFHRLDHCREHFREFHREDIDKRGVALTMEWCQDRNIKPTWWRCNKCLRRVAINEDGFQCPHCSYECPEVRRRVRLDLLSLKEGKVDLDVGGILGSDECGFAFGGWASARDGDSEADRQ